ncbi:protein turtle homolog A isoform X2 [Labeo rohita]|uniref:protein turtle homolog A isoform X2 n=1 Tax=Labeo rohita TaxID=84645 RepID=UPI0021E2CCA4|nr:protein turtle homolog A isoform X2 [Labeo rohita]
MVQKKLWLLNVTVAAALSLLRLSVSAESVVRARVGGFAELGCSLTPPSEGATTPNLFPLHVVEWVRLGYNVPILIKFGSYTPRVHPNYRGRVSLSRGASLLVDKLTLEDEGWFECRILLLDRTTDEFQNGTWNFLSISAPPVFIKTPPAFLEVMLGESLTLHCDAHGNPKPTIIWRKDGSDAKKQETIQVLNETLSLSKVTRETSGIYKCHVSNTEGNLTHTTQLQVKGPPIIIIPPEDTTMNMSQDAILQCQAEAYPSNLTYEWWKQGQNVYHIEILKSRVKIQVDGTLLISGLIPEDSGNYTCTPTNGLMTPPSASAYLKVKHPARVVRMPRETYLPVGMGGKIICPVQAEPPMLYVNWTKDGASLDLEQYPGWMVNSEGSVFITAANDDAVGMYTCTAYNSYGTMGQSEPTKVILKDPPSFRVSPRAEYLQEVGRELVIPCQSQGDPTPNITWNKVGPAPRSPFTVLTNGTLVLRPLSKDHQGTWECLASNLVATVSASTTILVLGTSPHAVTSVSVDPGITQANVSWEPGFDGGYTQKFTVWVKPTVRGKHEWASIPVPTSKTSMLVTGLQAATSYQFSVLAQNKLGSGPFSEIVTIRTLVAPTEAPTMVTTIAVLSPPTLLSANRTSLGVLLQWVPPLEESPPITSFVLQAKRGKGEWVTIDREIAVNVTELIVQGLVKDSNYELRLLSRRDKLVSAPSDSVVISTEGMEMYPAAPSLLAFVPEPLLAGVIGGVCFLFVAIILSLVTACVMNSRRRQRRRKKRDDIPSAFQKSSSPQAHSPSDSPDSVLKLKLCPPLNFFPNSSSSDRSDRSSFDKGSRSEYQDQRKQLLSSSSPPPHYTQFESHFGGSLSPTSAIESISRSPDGRFIIQPELENSTPTHIKKNLKKEFPQSPGRGSGGGSNNGSLKESSVSSERDRQIKMPSALTVDSPDPERPPHSPGRVKAMARNFSRHGCFYSDDEQGCSEALLERASFYSDCSEKRASDSLKKYRSASHREDPMIFPSLNRRARALERERLHHQTRYQPISGDSQLTEPSTMITQLDGERERDNLSKCLKLVKEREQMERELEHYTASRRAQANEREQRRAKSASPLRKWTGVESEDPIWKPQDLRHLRQKTRPSSLAQRVSDYRRGCYFGNTSSPMERLPSTSSTYIQWDISPVTSPTSQVPVQSLSEGNTPRSLYPHTHQQDIANLEDSTAEDVSHSPATQYTSLSLFSPTRNIPSHSQTNLSGARSRHPESHLEEEQELPTSTLVQEGWLQEKNTEKDSPAFRSTSPTHLSPQPSELHQVVPGEDRDTSPNLHYFDPRTQSVTDMEEVRAVQKDRLSRNPSGCSTLPYDHQKARGKGKVLVSEDSSSILPYGEQEKESIRARSRKSDKCVFSESPSRISPLTLLENEGENDQSNFSRMSESMKIKLAPQPARMSPLQTSTILEYLSLPGFIEMSVDDPVEVTESSESVEPSVEAETGTLLRDEPDVVPKSWEKHGQEHSEANISQHDHSTLNIPVEHAKPGPCSQLEARDTCGKPGTSDTSDKGFLPSKEKEKSSQPLLSHSSGSQKQDGTQRGPAQTLINTAKSMAAIVSKCPDSTSEQYQRPQAQGDQTNMISSRIYQAPVPFMKKSVSIGPCRTLSGVGQPRPFLKKSISLGSRWEHFENPRTYVSETCYRDEFPHPDIRLKSYSLGRTPGRYYPMSGPSWRGTVPFQPPSSYSLERRQHIEPPYHTPGPPIPDPPQHMESSLPSRRESDPRRQGAVFPDSSRWPLSYQETLRSVQHKYVPQDPSRNFGPTRPVARGDYLHPAEPRRCPLRPFLPRGYSWPSPYHASFPLREQDFPRQVDKGMGAVRGLTETEGRDIRGDGGRASYASQSSGRGSVGPYGHGHLRQSLSITPTLPSSPETTEESEMHRADKDVREQRSKRNTSVDESYEWDAVEGSVDPDILEAMKMERTHAGFGRGRELRQDRPRSTAGLQDFQSKRLYSISPPLVSQPPQHRYNRSLSEARFNALRQEFQEYRRAQQSYSQDSCIPPDPDSDSSSALL